MTLELQELRAELQSAQQKAEESQVFLNTTQVTHAEVLSQEQSQAAQLTQPEDYQFFIEPKKDNRDIQRILASYLKKKSLSINSL